MEEAYKKLEKKYARFTGARYAVSCNSGTSALHLALMALGIKHGDEVIIPDFTMAACAFAVSYTGAHVVCADVDVETYGLSYIDVARRITDKTKAIMLVHVYGRLARDTELIFELGRELKIPIVEDACEAQGAVYKSKADITCYSFYRNKIIAAQEGGMVTSDKTPFATYCQYLKNMAFGKDHDYFHEKIGYNYRMPNAQAELALESLRKYPVNAQARRLVESWYDERLLMGPTKRRDAVWFYDRKVPIHERRRILKSMPSARSAFQPISSMPMYGGGSGLPNARQLADSIVLLPVSPTMTKNEVTKICDIVQNV